MDFRVRPVCLDQRARLDSRERQDNKDKRVNLVHCRCLNICQKAKMECPVCLDCLA